MAAKQWVVHPNRSQIGADEPGRNGHYRPAQRRRRPVTESTCTARVVLPRRLRPLADPDGSLTFGGQDWWFVVGSARAFARAYTNIEVPPPFGFKDRGRWWWWDDTTTEVSILEGPEAIGYVEEYLKRLFPRRSITLVDRR
ncbi:hypothetical protein Mycsm_07117 (plasmid) [Mycobacterium sp. JS623]|uniref:hypothetical protein n=1 Tax=Mycobacterium sp. JS623 TaxID=212767 RepID=UPI0002A57CF6|nr:hypothetical protein [Mycobacterium sp. JS623]AGB27214.1 hypothetical protein Mycsm_07117 [Mycobacterium sp. JS623]